MADLRDLIPDIDKQLASAPEVDAGLDDVMENDVIPEWENNSPVDSGEYVKSIKVTQRARGGRGRVSATDPKAHIIEYGSEDTPEFAPLAKTQAHFNRGN